MTYTQTQLEQMTDADRDAVVATVVMGWVLSSSGRYWFFNKAKDGVLVKNWHPSISWSEMGNVWGKLDEDGFWIRLDNIRTGHKSFHRCIIDKTEKGFVEVKVRDTQSATLAVSIAAVLAVQEMNRW